MFTFLLFIINRLLKSNVHVKFVTNTTKQPLLSVHEKLTKLGFDVGSDEIFTSLTAARKFVERNSLRPFLLLEDVAKEDFHGQQFLRIICSIPMLIHVYSTTVFDYLSTFVPAVIDPKKTLDSLRLCHENYKSQYKTEVTVAARARINVGIYW